MSLIRLIYASKVLPEVEFGGLKEILPTSQANNERDGITGMLCFANPYFLQCLEGPRVAVTRTFTRICSDPRHSDIELIQASAIERRQFDIWSMKLVNLADMPRENMRRLLFRYTESERYQPDCMNAAQILAFMQDLNIPH